MTAQTAAVPETAPKKPSSRPPELQDWLNAHVYHPLSRRLAMLLAPTPVTPNMVSVAGGLCVVAAAVCYSQLAYPVSVVLGFAFHLLWHVVDGADGDLARMTGRTSATGELVDGVCDYVSHIVLYLTLAAMLDDTLGGWGWALAVAAGASHIAQTNHAESTKRTYLWWAYGVPWLKQSRAQDERVFTEPSLFTRIFGGFTKPYLALAAAMSGSSDAVEAVFARAAGDPELTQRLRAEVRTWGRKLTFWPKLVGPNPRAFLLAAGMALGSPAYFFGATCVLLNILLAISILRQRVENDRLAARLEAIAGEA